MREEVSAERLRMTDQGYINLHLNTPGYRTYRPAWKMIAWHVTAGSGSGEESRTLNDRKRRVLDSLTDAQKDANTTRGSTPGLIDPALGEVSGNRVALPDLVLRKRGRRRANVNVSNTPATQLAQPHKLPQASHLYQNQQFPQSSRASSANIATAQFPVASARMGSSSQDFASNAAVPGQNDLRGYANAQARDAAAMPPPPLPHKPRNGRFSHPQKFGPHPDPPYSTNRQPEFDDTQASFMEVEDFRATATYDHVPRPEHQFMSDEEIATMSAKSDEAMAEILWMCEPFLGPVSKLQGPPPIDVSAEPPVLIEELEMSFMLPIQAGGRVRGNWNEDAMPHPAQSMHARDMAQRTTPRLSEKQGIKRKECDGGNENLRHLQLDVERQERRPIKRVKSVHNANLQYINTASYHDAAHDAQQQNFDPHPQLGDYQSGYLQRQTFSGPALQDARAPRYGSFEDVDPYTCGAPSEGQYGRTIGQQPTQVVKPYQPQYYPVTSFRPNVPDHQPRHQRSVASPYIPVFTAKDQNPGHQTSTLQPRGSVGLLAHGDIQAGQALGHPSSMFSHPFPTPRMSATSLQRCGLDQEPIVSIIGHPWNMSATVIDSILMRALGTVMPRARMSNTCDISWAKISFYQHVFQEPKLKM
ncbi:hypothetical protein HO173_000546 [Letharia columbiana]|uniref:Uncharacterized protein n=1 Tax=Letharia columbiana TaxID=112416 RepID=A0A8H6G7H8_9LECA|nr:uncharacterized protein HO173_000546 [Letharia columbiana]KAF6241834.1 hypothetical protein HO173_000546 [Letharia columbiana]